MDPPADVWVMCIYSYMRGQEFFYVLKAEQMQSLMACTTMRVYKTFRIHQNTVCFAISNEMNTQINPCIIYYRSVAISLN